MRELIRIFPGARYLAQMYRELYGNGTSYGVHEIRFQKRPNAFCDDSTYEVKALGSDGRTILSLDYSVTRQEPFSEEIKRRFDLSDAPLEQFYSLKSDMPEIGAKLLTAIVHQSKFTANRPFLIRLLETLLSENGIAILSPASSAKIRGDEKIDLYLFPNGDQTGGHEFSFLNRDCAPSKTPEGTKLKGEIRGYRFSLGLDRPRFEMIGTTNWWWSSGDDPRKFASTSMSYSSPFGGFPAEDRIVLDYFSGCFLDHCILERDSIFFHFLPLMKKTRSSSQRYLEIRFEMEKDRLPILIDLEAKDLDFEMFLVEQAVSGLWMRRREQSSLEMQPA